MVKFARMFLVAVVVGSFTMVARADEGDGANNRAKMEQAKRAIAAMRESYAYVLKKEEEAKAEHDPVRLNALHQIVLRIADLVNVSDHALDDMRVAITSNEAPEAVDAELEKIMLAKTKVEQARREADRTVGVKMISSNTDTDATSREFSEGSDALTAIQQNGTTGVNSSSVVILSNPPPITASTPGS